MRLKTLILLFISQPFFIFFSAQASAEYWLYAFRPGDTLWAVCRQFTNRPNCWQTIGRENGVVFPRRIPPGTIIKFPVSWLKTIPKPVTISYVRGNVSFTDAKELTKKATSESIKKNAANAKIGDELAIGTIIFVGENSNATLKFADGTVMLLEQNSELHLNALSTNGDTGMVDSRVRLNRGAAVTRVPKRKERIHFQIETPSAVAAVRGTEFRVSNDTDDTNISRTEVLEGLVGVSSSVSEKDVAKGFGVMVQKDTAPSEPVQLLSSPIFTKSDQDSPSDTTVNWEPLEGAKKYRATLLSSDKKILKRKTLGDNIVKWEDLAIGCYTTKVSGIDQNKLIGVPAELDFCIQAALAKVNLTNKNITQNDKETLKISWPAIENATSYVIEYSLRSDFEKANTITSTNNVALIPFDAKSKYFIRVTAKNSSGLSSPTGNAASWSPNYWDKIIALGAAGIVLLLIL